jgi:gliding motility-associated-like protein
MLRMIRALLPPWCLLLLVLDTHGQGALRFTANHGQWPDAVTHRAEMSGAFIWVEKGGIVIDRYDAELVARAHGNIHFDPVRENEGLLRHHAVRLRFLSAEPGTDVSATHQLPGHHSYFLGNDPARWAGRVPSFGSITLHGVAPGCDAVVREGRSGLKYDLVLAPGADPAAIRFTYEGADELKLRDGALLVGTSLGRLVERIPLAYQDIGGERRTVRCTYTLKDGVVGVRPGKYDPAHTLVIDPSLSFATYSGSVSNNFGYTASFDREGYLYAGSTAFGNQYPVTMGAYMTTWAGGTTDIALTKYDTTGSFLVWSTYLGGSAAEMPHSLIVDENDQLLVLGTTGSNNFPTTAGAYDGTFGGGTPFTPVGLGLSYPNGSDMIISRLSADGGNLLGSTYLGGSGNDGLNSAAGLKFNYADEVRGEVLLDEAGNVWVVSCTQSTNMPITTGAAQPAFGGGTHDGYVARFNPGLTQLQYASYIGGSGADAVYAGDLDDLGRLYVCGGTNSTDLPATPGAVSAAFNGGAADAFTARFTANGSAVDALTYWGSAAYDQAYFVELDGDGAVYLFGQTAAPSGQLIQNAPYNIPAGGQFITKFSPDLDAVALSSRIGSGDGSPDISPTAFLVDVCNKIYTSGWGSSAGGLGGQLSTNGLPVTADAHQGSTDGNDLYLAVFDIDMTALFYATYYGGGISPEHVDGGTSRFDRRGRVYQSVCAGCQGNSDFPTTPGAWSSTNNSTGCNNGVLKFDFDAPLVIAAFSAPDTVCAPDAIAFTNLSGGASGYLWDFGDGNSSTAVSPTHTYAAPGTYTVTLTAINPNTCNEEDVAVRTVFVDIPGPELQAMADVLLCGPLDGFTLSADGFGTADGFLWSSDPLFSDTLNADPADSTAFVSPALSGTYHVQAFNASSCVARDSVTVTVSLAAMALLGDTLICGGDTATLVLLGADPGSAIEWEPADAILGGQGTATASTAPVESTGFGVQVTAPSGCSWSGTIGVSVSPITAASVSATADQTTVLPGTVVQLGATPTEGVTYSWQPAGLVSDPTQLDPTATVQQTTTFTVTVSDGICTKDGSVTVTVYELICEEPDIFVPNSFTPNGDGMNDVLFVRGRHITDLEFLVFDRWGEKVFETRDQGVGWDGTFRGAEVGPAVFVYHLTAWCLDGQRYFTKGNVTVIR